MLWSDKASELPAGGLCDLDTGGLVHDLGLRISEWYRARSAGVRSGIIERLQSYLG